MAEFTLSTGDPRFDPANPVRINGYLYVRVGPEQGYVNHRPSCALHSLVYRGPCTCGFAELVEGGR